VTAAPSAASASPRHVLTAAELEASPWAACGPTSVSALLGRSLVDIRYAFPRQTEKLQWANLAMVGHALDVLGVVHRATPPKDDLKRPAKAWSRCGLVLVQLMGRWDQMPVNHPAQLRHTHWIAVAPAGHPVGDRHLPRTGTGGAFDVNLVGAEGLEDQHGWTPIEVWKRAMPKMLAAQTPGATGGWWVRAGIEAEVVL
jgi:hypothetical protein